MLVTPDLWQGRRVLVTGHTGFKGGWLALWLHRLGAHVSGLSLPAPTDPSFFVQTRLADLVDHREGDVRDMQAVAATIAATRPEVVFHLAAQPLVRYAYEHPVETYATNVMGTVHALEACRAAGGVRALVCVTSDKCYENREWVWPYRETDPMGGHDPYSSSKGAAELAVAAWRRSYPGGAGIASVRAGNVIGGGDWADDRLVPDLVRALIADVPVQVRNPASIRPWQHVLDALSGYLLVAERLFRGEEDAAAAWNFGPGEDDVRPVGWIVDRLLAEWGSATAWEHSTSSGPHEAVLLRLDSSKARGALGWRPKLRLDEALALIVAWHRHVADGGDARDISLRQIDAFARLRAA